MDTGVGGGTKAESDKPAYVIGLRRLGVLMAVAHKPGLSDSAEIFTSKKRRRPIPARRTACPGTKQHLSDTRSGDGLPGDGLFFTRRKLGRGRRSASAGGD